MKENNLTHSDYKKAIEDLAYCGDSFTVKCSPVAAQRIRANIRQAHITLKSNDKCRNKVLKMGYRPSSEGIVVFWFNEKIIK